MAGGKGSRMEPFTKILPKALLPINNKPIIEMIIDEFRKWGVKKYYITLNDKGEMVEAYFNSISKNYEIKYIWEKKRFLGTAGSLKFLENKIRGVLIVSNCDIIVKANFQNVIHFHKKHDASLTILSSMRHYKIPYGVIKFKEGGEVIEVCEKPEYTFPVNTGVYILNAECLNLIPKGSHFDMTDLIRCIIKNNKKVFMYPVNESDYIDIGQWEEYKETIKKLQIS
jgi:NDP-sugar pyrophosphorylase family protein